MKPTDVPYIKPESKEIGKKYACLKCKEEFNESEGWLSRTGFICDRCQKLNELAAGVRKDKRKIVVVTQSDMSKVQEGDTFFLEYKKHQTACQVYEGEQMLYTADKVPDIDGKWVINGGWFNIELEEV